MSDPLRDPWRADKPQYRLETFPSAEVQRRQLALMKGLLRLQRASDELASVDQRKEPP